MINVRLYKTPKKEGLTSSVVGATVVNVQKSAEAVKAGYATKAGKADVADSASYANNAGQALRANYADKARELDENATALSKYLRKDQDDTASGLITLLKGLAIGGAKKYGIDPEGVATLLKVIADSGVIDSLTNTTLTNTTLSSEDASIRNLTVTGAAHFFQLIIDEIKASGGSVLVTPANGFKVAKVVKDGVSSINNTWKVETYNFYKQGTSQEITKEDFTGKEPDGKYYITDETFSTDMDVPVGRDYFAYRASTYAVFSDDTTADVTITTDDGGALYINGVLVQQYVTCRATKTTLHFKKGINAVEFYLNEYTGYNYTHIFPCLTKLPCCEGLSTSIDDIILYFKAEDGERAVTNKWKVGMQAVSMSFNAATGETLDASNHYWWRLVTGVSSKPVTPEWDKEHKYHWITVSDTDAASGSAVPSENDEVAQLGYRVQGDSDPELRTYTDTDGTVHKYCPLQSAIYLSAYDSLDSGLVAPFLAFYRGISDFDLKSHRKTYFDSVRNMLVGDVYNISSMVEDVVLSKPVIGYEITCKVNGVVAETINYDAVKAAANSSIEFDFYKHGEAYNAPRATIGCYDKDGLLQGELVDVSDTSTSVVSGGNMYLQPTAKTIVCTLYDASGAKVKERGVGVVRDGAQGEDATSIRMELRSTPFADIYHEGDSYNATLTLVVFESKGSGEPKDVTSTIPTTRFRWTRTTSRGGDSDTGWNDIHANTGNALTLTEKDLDGDTYFLGELLSSDGTTTLKAVSVNI